jgi:hypothetical protein
MVKKKATHHKYVEKIAVCMVSQYKRHKFLPLLFECIKNQTYPRELFVEFIIVDGSKDDLEQPLYEKFITDLNKDFQFPIKYISTSGDKNKNVGRLRNISLENVSEDKNIQYIICLDDDDYQFKTRFEETVKAFKRTRYNLVGCNDQYMYDFNTDTTLRFIRGIWGQYHSVASSYSVEYKYAKSHKYDEEKVMGEENSFTNDFKEPMAQLNSNDNIVGFSYMSGNTFNKVQIVLGNILNSESKERTANVYIQDGLIEKLIGKKVFEKWMNVIKEVSNFKEESDFDITYYTTSGFGIEWSPEENNLGGSEHHIQEVCEYWKRKGLKVEVYCALKHKEPVLDFNGVIYKDFKLFEYRKHYNILVIWRHLGIPIFDKLKFNAKQIYCDWHDSAGIQFDIAAKNHEKLNGVMVKHHFHNEVGNFLSKSFEREFPKEKIYTIPNGIRKDVFEDNFYDMEKSRYKCVYASSYVRGIVPFLKYSFPIIKKAIPEFEIHICYGMEQETPEFQNMMRLLICQDGIYEYGKLNKDLVAKLKWSCGFHLYPCLDPLPEIYCISLHESYLTRTIPILFNINLFKHLPSIHCDITNLYQEYQGEELMQKCYERYADSVITVLTGVKEEELESIRDTFEKNPNIKTWEEVSDQWINVFKQNKK